MFNNKTVSSIILCAGNSIRMGLDKNKVYCEINGKYVIEYSIKTFDVHKYIDDIYIVTRKEDEKFLLELLNKMNLQKNIHIVYGGEFRCLSVYNALKEINSDYVIIHDGARPFVTNSYISLCVENMEHYKGAIIGTKNNEILMKVNANIVQKSNENENLFQVQTPQCFHTNILKKSYDKLENPALATDDSYLLENFGYEVKLIDGSDRNIKITNSKDISIAISCLNKEFNR